jgi:hypothetical protein
MLRTVEPTAAAFVLREAGVRVFARGCERFVRYVEPATGWFQSRITGVSRS